MLEESEPATNTPDVATETTAWLPLASVKVATLPTLAVDPLGRMTPDEPATALIVLVPTTATTVGCVLVWTNTPPALFVVAESPTPGDPALLPLPESVLAGAVLAACCVAAEVGVASC